VSDPTFSIREASPADAGVIADLTRRAFAEQAALYSDDTLPPLSDTAETVLDAMEQGLVLVAEDADGSVVGSVRGVMREGCCLVGRLVVEPEDAGARHRTCARIRARGAVLLGRALRDLHGTP
jgi:predicted N-acetyltransferase YhbS